MTVATFLRDSMISALLIMFTFFPEKSGVWLSKISIGYMNGIFGG